VDNYDIDAIHFDDYFYPYKVAKTVFPDKATYDNTKSLGKAKTTGEDRMSTNWIFALNQTIQIE